MRRNKVRSAAAIILVVAVLAIASMLLLKPDVRSSPRQAPLGLFTTLPLLWSESDDIGAALRHDVPQHWALAELERYGALRPLDLLSRESLAGLTRLVMAQPRVMGAQENVALDDWVRGGGQLLLFADPALTEESAFPIGDLRRPQDVVLLSPILTRWGLDLHFDAEQELADRNVPLGRASALVRLPGTFTVRPGSPCAVESGGLLAQCRIGKGQVVALADAALLERANPAESGAEALSVLLDRAFGAD